MLQPQQKAEILGDDPLVVSPTSEPIPQNVSGSTIYAENSTIIAGEGSQIINPNATATPQPTPEPTPFPQPTPIPTPQPMLYVAYMNNETINNDFGNGTIIEHFFKVTTNVQLQYASSTVNHAIAPLATEHNLITAQYDILTVRWRASQFIKGESTFRLYSENPLSDSQLETLATDLQNALATMLT